LLVAVLQAAEALQYLAHDQRGEDSKELTRQRRQ
jgi:hypothetical protein